MRLLVSLTSPYARKLRVLVQELALDVSVEPTMPTDDAPELLRANPLAKVPALILATGEAVFDSPVIAAMLLGLSPGQQLLPAAGIAHWRVRTLEALTDGILDAALALRIEASHDAAGRNPVWPTRYRRAIDRALADLPPRLAALAGEASGYADICTVVTLEYLDFRFPDIDWRGAHPALAALHARLADRPSLLATRPPA